MCVYTPCFFLGARSVLEVVVVVEEVVVEVEEVVVVVVVVLSCTRRTDVVNFWLPSCLTSKPLSTSKGYDYNFSLGFCAVTQDMQRRQLIKRVLRPVATHTPIIRHLSDGPT